MTVTLTAGYLLFPAPPAGPAHGSPRRTRNPGQRRRPATMGRPYDLAVRAVQARLRTVPI